MICIIDFSAGVQTFLLPFATSKISDDTFSEFFVVSSPSIGLVLQLVTRCLTFQQLKNFLMDLHFPIIKQFLIRFVAVNY